MTNLFKGKTYEGTSFIIDKIYPNKKAMDAAAATDDVFVGRYVLVSYTDKHLEQDERDSIALQLQGHISLGLPLTDELYVDYVTNICEDNEIVLGTVTTKKITSNDKVVYRKMCRSGQQKYEEVASLNTTANKFIKGISKDDKILTISNDVNKVLEAHLSFEIETEEKTDTTETGKKLIEKYLVVYGKDKTKGKHIAKLDLTDYYKDIFLAGVSWDKGNHALKFLIGDKDDPNVVTETTITIDLMDAGDGIDIGTNFDDDNTDGSISGPKISINLDEETGYTNYLQVGLNGLATTEALSDAINDFDAKLTALEDTEYIKDLPYIRATVIGTGNYEIGSVIQPTIKNIKVVDGKYKHPQPNGTPMEVSENIQTAIKLDGISFISAQKITIDTADYNKSFTLSGQIGASPNIPVSNLGVRNENAQYTGERITDNKDTEGNQRVRFQIGDKTQDYATITGYREGCYYGTTTNASFNINAINSDFIRGLTSKTKKNYNTGIVTSSFTIPKGTTAIIIACPADCVGPSEVLNTTNNSPMTELMGANNHKKIVSVYSANEYDQKDYKVWVFKPDTGAYETKQTLKITLG